MTNGAHKTPKLDGIASEIQRLDDGCTLLEDIWAEMTRESAYRFPDARNPHQPGRRATKEELERFERARALITRMHQHFGFDDSE